MGSCLRRTCAHTDLEHIATAREEATERRHLQLEENPELKRVLIGIMVTTIFFPPTGILALYGGFDSTIAWCTHGAMYRLTNEHRSILRQMLVVVFFVYTITIVAFAVSFGVH